MYSLCKPYLAFLIVSMFVTFGLYAKDEKPTKIPSSTVREAKQIPIHGHVDLQVFPNLGTVFGVSSGFFISPNLIIEGRYAAGYSWEWFSDKQLEIRSVIGLVSLRMFLGNSFNFSGGLATRNMNFKEMAFLGVGAVSHTQNITTAGSQFAFGNRWQWNYTSFGMDWLSIYVPLNSSSKVLGSSHFGDAEAEKIEARNKAKAKRVHVALSMSLGACF